MYKFECHHKTLLAKNMLYLLIVLHFPLIIIASRLVISKVEMRSIRINDIGLYFDVHVNNIGDTYKETLDFAIQSDKCCLKINTNVSDCEMSKLVGGEFEQVPPGRDVIVTLIWPTLTLINREGFCAIQLIATKANGVKINVTDTINFNTTFDLERTLTVFKNIAPHMFSPCATYDLNPLRQCEPDNCEEKYFGKRNYFNSKTKLCELVPDCKPEKDIIYNFYTNECVDLKHILTDEDLEKLEDDDLDLSDEIWDENIMIGDYPHLHSNMKHSPQPDCNAKKTPEMKKGWSRFWKLFIYYLLCVIIGAIIYIFIATIVLFCIYYPKHS